MIDIHTHILPGVDDGVETEDAAVEFARVAQEDGTTVIVATPHAKEGFYDNPRDSVLAGVERLSARLAREGIGVRVEPGAEVHICPDLVARIRDGRAPTLADNGKTLLLELSLSQHPVELENLVFQLQLAGILVVFAHPERIRYFQDDPRRYEDVVRLGAFGQITTGSILGVFGSEIRAFSAELLRTGMVHVLASDAHNVRGRAPRLSAALQAMEPMIGGARARAMVEAAPRALLEGRAPELPPLEGRAARKPSLLRRWLSRTRR